MLQDSPVSKQSWPLDHDLFIRSAADTIRRLRNHACIALWCGGNEQMPAADIDAALQVMLPRRPTQPSHHLEQVLVYEVCKDISSWTACFKGRGRKDSSLRCLDASRAYVSGSLWSGFGEGHGAFSDGPYGCQSPAAFFNPAFYLYAFNPEVSCSFEAMPYSVLGMSLNIVVRGTSLSPRSVVPLSWCADGC